MKKNPFICIHTKSWQCLLRAKTHFLSKFYKNQFSGFCVILHTNQPNNQPTNGHGRKHNLLVRCKNNPICANIVLSLYKAQIDWSSQSTPLLCFLEKLSQTGHEKECNRSFYNLGSCEWTWKLESSIFIPTLSEMSFSVHVPLIRSSPLRVKKRSTLDRRSIHPQGCWISRCTYILRKLWKLMS